LRTFSPPTISPPLHPSPSFSFRLPPTRRWEGKEEGRRGGRKRERERRRGGDRELGENSGWGEEKLKKMEKDKGERERHAAITPVAGKFVEAQIRAYSCSKLRRRTFPSYFK